MISDGDKALVSAAQLDTPRLMPHQPLRLGGLDAQAIWRVRLLNPAAHPERRLKVVPAMVRGEPVTARGSVLQHAGLTLPVLMSGEIAVYSLEKVP
jgi:alpha-galactosidase